ncbi:hypothetical protein IU486_19930 [Streptomyces gardneri]|uniref:hypothetical protein n=1 Tax=Nocardia abscessus TaxID=120957 RepID=UPI001893B6A3|nr:hypothetical protein [Nocardia abscessus]MBF6167000.1 hypothetical protein [Streptomyces gardneri]
MSSVHGFPSGVGGADGEISVQFEPAGGVVEASSSMSGEARRVGIPFAFPVELPVPPMGEFICATTTIDPAGRLGDRSVIKRLGWAAGQPVSIEPSQGLLRLRAVAESESSIAANGYMFLPVSARRAVRLHTSDRVLMAGGLDCGVLVICPLRAVGAALWSYRPDLFEAVV